MMPLLIFSPCLRAERRQRCRQPDAAAAAADCHTRCFDADAASHAHFAPGMVGAAYAAICHAVL